MIHLSEVHVRSCECDADCDERGYYQLLHARCAGLRAYVERGLDLVYRIQRDADAAVKRGVRGFRRSMILVEREARVRRLIHEALDKEMGAPAYQNDDHHADMERAMERAEWGK